MVRVGDMLAKGAARHGGGAKASPRVERMWHVFWATVLTAILAGGMLLTPLDWFLWTLQSRLGDRQPSGEFVFVLAESGAEGVARAEDRKTLARALDTLRAANASRVFVDLPIAVSNDSSADAALRRSLAAWGDRLTIVNRIEIGAEGRHKEVITDAGFATGHPTAWSEGSNEWPGHTWTLPTSYRTSAGEQPSLAAALARIDASKTGRFHIDYRFRSLSIRKISASDLASPAAASKLADLTGKTIVIGTARNPAAIEYQIPAQVTAPASFVSIYAAETLRGEPVRLISAVVLPLLVIALLAAAAFTRGDERRRQFYLAATILPLFSIFAAQNFNLRIELAYTLPLLLTFALLRSRANWVGRVSFTDVDTGLPTVRAMARRLDPKEIVQGHIVVAKLHGYESLLRSLDTPQRAAYILKLVERLKVGDPQLTVFLDGHQLAWRAADTDEAKLREHLEGLRAIFAAPVVVDGQIIDVGITFGAAALAPDRFDRALAAALAAVEETTEALEPVRFADPVDADDTLWDISLRARIDAAMEAGEVFCVYQPKMRLVDNAVVGVEALVRWEDPDRGFIPPLHFIMQCEKAGRMEYLTRYVLQSACSAGQLLHFSGKRLTMSVNISATLLTDMRIVGIVRNVLQATGFDPHHLMLEITETARLHDFAQAKRVLSALKALGTQLSMDDFGVGAANFETLQQLPFDEIKIDRQFVSQAVADPKSRAIVESIVGLGTKARIAVVAEGAENEVDLALLREVGCNQVQGYAIARPLPLTNLLNFMAARENGDDSHSFGFTKRTS